MSVSEVSGATQLPYGAQRAVGQGDCEVVVCIGVLSGSPAVLSAVANTVFSGIQEVSLGASVPIIPGLIDEAQPDTQIIGSTLATSALKMAQLTSGSSGVSDMGPTVTQAGPSSAAAAAAPVADSSMDAYNAKTEAPKNILDLLTNLRESLKKRGARGIFGLGRKFRIIDDDGSGELDLSEFTKAISEHSMDWTDEDVKSVFDYFDEGTVSL
jgi:hypothetical protein